MAGKLCNLTKAEVHWPVNNMPKPYIIYLSPYDILRPRTNQVSDVRFTEGFAQNGCHTHLIVPFVQRKDNIHKDEVHNTYGLKSSLHIHYLPTKFINDVYGKRQLLEVTWYAIRKTISILRQRHHPSKTYIISRSTHLLRPFFILRKILPGIFKNVSIIHWAHDFHRSASHRSVYRKSDFLLATNSSILNDLLNSVSRSQNEGSITLNPITDSQATEVISKNEAKKETQLEKIATPIIAYTGKLGKNYDKEIKFILGAAKLLPQYTFLFTGGKPDAVQFWEDYCHGQGLKNIIFTGYIHDYRKIRYYQQAADVLVSYYTHQGHDIRYNLPNKLCEYMLTGNIIITPNYPATSDLLNDNNCIFTKPEDSGALAKSISDAINFPDISSEKAKQAASDVREITFKKVTARLIEQFPQ